MLSEYTNLQLTRTVLPLKKNKHCHQHLRLRSVRRTYYEASVERNRGLKAMDFSTCGDILFLRGVAKSILKVFYFRSGYSF